MTPDVVSQVKAQVSDSLRAKNGQQTAGMVRAGSFGQDKPTSGFNPLALGAGVCLLVGIVAWMGGRSIEAGKVNPTSTNHAQIDLAMQMLANQQAINDRLLIGQQELSETIIENAKPNHTTVFCIGSRMCPGNAPSNGGVMVQPAEPQAYPDPVTSVAHVSDVDRAWANHYQQLRQSDESAFNADWRECIHQNWLPVTPQINCPALSKELQR